MGENHEDKQTEGDNKERYDNDKRRSITRRRITSRGMTRTTEEYHEDKRRQKSQIGIKYKKE